MKSNKLVQILKSETAKALAIGTAAFAIPFFGRATFTYSHNATYDNLVGKKKMCAIARETDLSSEILEKDSNSTISKAVFPGVYFLAHSTDLGNKTYEFFNCK
jgi:hypothetical protein